MHHTLFFPSLLSICQPLLRNQIEPWKMAKKLNQKTGRVSHNSAEEMGKSFKNVEQKTPLESAFLFP